MSQAKNSTLGELLNRWHGLHKQGQSLSLEELCADSPERLEEFKRHLHDVAAMQAFLQLSTAQTNQTQVGNGVSAAGFGAAQWVVAGYEILGELGRGGMGVVYRAQQVKARRQVALKMLPQASHAGESELARFRTEIEAAARLQHPNIVQVFEVGEHGGLPFYSMEFCPGGSLAHRLTASTLPAGEAASVVELLARAMHEAHRQGVVHRDLKPANILLAGGGPDSPLIHLTPKIADFGLARKLDDARQTQTGAVIGTPSYMPPEQAEGTTRKHGPAVDVYALGAVLYECLTGRPPFKAATTLETLFQVMRDDPVPPSRLVPSLPRDLETVCLKCLHKEPARRYATAEALADDLKRYQSGEPIAARPAGWVERGVKWARRRWVVASLLALSVGLILSLLVAAVVLWQNAEQRAGFVRDLDTAHRQLEGAGERLEETDRLIADREQKLEGVRRQSLLALADLHRTRREVYASDMLLAARAWQEGQITLLDGILQRYASPSDQEDLRGWEWRYLHRARHSNQLTLQDHKRTVFGVAFSPDGQRLATCSSDQTVLIWDVRTLQRTHTLRGHPATLNAVAFSPDGKTVLATSSQGPGARKVVRWDLASSKVVQLSPASQGPPGFPMLGTAFSLDRTRVAWCQGAEASVHDLQREQDVHHLRGHLSVVECVSFSPNGRQIATASRDQTVKVWDTVIGKEILTLKGHTSWVVSVAFCPSGRLVAAGATDGTIRVWDLESGREIRTLRGHSTRAQALAFSPDGLRLASGAGDHLIKIWEIDTERPPLTLKGHAAQVWCVTFSPDGQLLASASQDGTAKIWEATRAQEARTLPQLDCHQLAFRSQDRQLISVSGGTASIWDVTVDQETRRLPSSNSGLVVSGDGKSLAGVSPERSLKIWDVDSGKGILEIPNTHTGRLAFSADSSHLAGWLGLETGKPGFLKIWEITTHRETVIKDLPGIARDVRMAFSPDGTLLVGGGEQMVSIWETRTGRTLRSFRVTDRSVNSLAFHPNGQTLAIGSSDLLVTIWEITTGKKLQTMKSPSDSASVLVFSPDGNRLASGHNDGVACLWDARTGHQLLTIQAHPSGINSLVFSPDGNRLITACGHDSIRIWDATPQADERESDRRAIDLLTFLFSRPLAREDVIASIRSHPGISDEVRQTAFALAPRFKEEIDGKAYHSAAERLVRLPHLNATQYQFARSQANTTCRLAPDNPVYLGTRGMAEYRVGQYAEAAASLTRAVEQQGKLPTGVPVPSLAFLAMALHQTGKQAEARATLERLRIAVKGAEGTKGAAQVLREAESLIRP